MKVLKKLFLIVVLLCFSSVLIFSAYYVSVTAGITLQEEKLTNNCLSMKIYDDEGAIIPCGNSCINAVEFDNFPTHLVNAFIATEDRNFFSHNGLDVKRMVKALLKNVASLSINRIATNCS